MGHKSYQEVDVSTQIVGTVTQSNYSDCATYSGGGNSFTLTGSGNVIDGVDQTLTISVDEDCVTADPLNYSFTSRIQNNVIQQMADQEVAMTQWMDNSKDSATTHISSDLELNLTQTNSQDCENSLNDNNTFTVTGDSNVVKDVSQQYTIDTITNCHMRDGASFKASDTITNTLNQHTVYTAVNPFAFITNAIVAVADSIALLVAFCFIILLCFVALFAVLRHRSKNRQRAEAEASGRSTGGATPA